MNWFNPDEAMRTGTYTSGTSGSGKTVLNFWIAERLMNLQRWKAPTGKAWNTGTVVYVIDPSRAWRRSSIPNILDIKVPMKLSWQDGTAAQSTIFDVSMLTYPERVHFTETFCRLLLDARKKSGHYPPTYVIFEEGQLYFPQGCMRSMKKHSHAVELVTNGRNFNLRFGVITQFPSMIDKLLVKMCRQRFFGWTNEPNDMRYIEEIIGKKMAEELPKLEVGEFVYSYPVRKGGTTKIKVPMFKAESTPTQLPTYPMQTAKPKQTAKQASEFANITLSIAFALIFFLMLLVAA